MKYKPKIVNHIAMVTACCAMIFWGCSYIWSTIVFTYWTPITTIMLRSLFAALLLFVGLKVSGKSIKIASVDYKILFLLALLNPFLYFIFESYGLKYSSPVTSAGIIALIPVFSSIMAIFVLRERLHIINIIGIGISFVGVCLLLYAKDIKFDATWYGVLFLFLAVASAVVYTIFIPKMAKKYNPFVIIAWLNLVGGLLLCPIFFISSYKNLISTPITLDLLTAFLPLLFFASVLAFPFYTYSIKILGVSRSSVFSNLIPVITIIVSFLILRESITIYKTSGTGLAILGVFLTQIKKTYHRGK